jgi:hypothetical protein
MEKENISQKIKDQIIKEYMLRSYHWTFAVSGLIIGFLLGIIAAK